MIAGGCC